MKLSPEEVKHVAELAKLTLSDEEVTLYADQLSAILEYAEAVLEIDTSSVPPTPYVLPVVNVMREDEPEPSLENDTALANAPESDDGFFRCDNITTFINYSQSARWTARQGIFCGRANAICVGSG